MSRHLRTIKEVYRRPTFFFLATLIAGLFLLLALWLQNPALFQTVFFSPRLELSEKALFLLSTYRSLETSLTPVSRYLTIIVAFLFGLNSGLLAFYLSQRRKMLRELGTPSLTAATLGVLGIGCSSCGSALLSLLGLSGVLSLLPLKGTEFSLLSIVLLVYAANKTTLIIENESLCPSKKLTANS